MEAANRTLHEEPPELVDAETAYLIIWLFTFVITPCISVCGIFGNCVNVYILRKHGLDKSSNLLLFALAISDTCFLVGYNNIPKMIYDFGDVEGFDYSRGKSTVLYVLYEFFDVLDWGGGYVSFILPMLITIERLIAVFLPLHFSRIVTHFRVSVAIVTVYIIFMTYIMYIRCWFTLTFVLDPKLNKTIGVIRRSQMYYDQKEAAAVMADVINVVLHNIPVAIVIAGSCAIGVKLRWTYSQRKKLTSSAKNTSESQNRTTKTLLAVCAVYTVTCLICQLPSYFPQYMYYSAYTDKPNRLANILYRAMNIMIAINSSANFVIYVAMNPKFRASYLELFCSWRQGSK